MIEIWGKNGTTFSICDIGGVAVMEKCLRGHSITTNGQDEGEGGQKKSVFVHAQGIKTVHAGREGQKVAKFCPRSC